jgi:hypothetical protein
MYKKFICLIFLSVLFGLTFTLQAQSFKLTGKFVDTESQAPLTGVYVSVSYSNNDNFFVTVITDKNGDFSINDLKLQVKYKLTASYVSYLGIVIPFEGKGKILDLGTLSMTIKSHNINEVVVKGNIPSAIQKGDTVEMNAGAYITTRDASAQDLVRKMPGITIENGTVKAHGEPVVKVLVDGKEFFGEDPSTALNNLPAEIIDKVQVFDRLSEQAQFTGFDDGNSEKTINVITKQNRQNGEFGKFYGGSDFKSKYLLGGNLNIFNKQRRISLLGLLNNINQQNFSQQDLLGVTSANGKHDGGFTIGQQNGLNITRSTGFNYVENWGKKFIVTGSYFLSSNENTTVQVNKKDKFLYPKSDHFSTESDSSNSKKFNNRFHMRIEYNIDSLNSIISTSKINFQSTNSDKFSTKKTTKNGGVFVNSLNSNNKDYADGYNFSNEVVIRHKLNKPRRTISIAITTSANDKGSKSDQVGELKKTSFDSIPTNQHIDGINSGYKIASNIVYIEPLSTISMLHFELNNAITNSRKDREAYNLDNNSIILNHLDSLSNNFKSDYFNNHAGVDYRIKTENIKFSIGTNFQHAIMSSYETYPIKFSVPKVFNNFLPNFQFNLKDGANHNLKILYRTSTDAPGISQLQNVVDNSDKANLVSGNPYLQQEYTHSFTCNYSFANPETSISSTLVLNGLYTMHYVGNQIIIASKDTFIKDANVYLSKNMQLSRPENFDHFTNLRTYYNFCFPIKLIMCKLNLTTGLNYSQTPGYINQNLNLYNLYSASEGMMLSSYISENIDFTLSYNFNYSIIRNSIVIAKSNIGPRYIYQSGGAKITWVFWKGIVLQNEFQGQRDNGFQFYNQDYILWNAYIGKRLFNENGELKISVFDLLNKNINIAHSVTPQYIQDSKTNVLHQYFMLTFTYNLRNFQGTDQTEKIKKDKKVKKDKKAVF